jgi:hypothetical protein
LLTPGHGQRNSTGFRRGPSHEAAGTSHT